MYGSEPSFRNVDLTNCDREPIHIPGSIQPHGALLVVDPNGLKILQAAGATEELLGRPVEALVGYPLATLLAPRRLDRLQAIAGRGDLTRPVHMLDFCAVVEGRSLDASIHKSEGAMIIEFEVAAPDDPHADDPLASVQEMLDAIGRAEGLQAFCQAAAEQVRRVTRYGRVMVYRFLPDDSGWVFAEARDEDMDSFLGLHYPASDIPRQARALYLRNWLRIIADVDSVPAPLLPAANPLTGRPFDLSQATLRSVSPVHLDYLRNMNVAASMSISIVKGGRLWGLIACHHGTPKRLPRHLRAVCELFGQMFSFQLEARERAEALEHRHRANGVHAELVAKMSREDDLAGGLIRSRPTILDYLDAEGVALLVDGKYGSIGRTPRESQVRALVRWLDDHTPEGIFVTNALSEVYDLGRDFAIDGSGVLAICASRSPSDFILWFRPEIIETVRWAGDPRKPVNTDEQGQRLSPRKSFAAWTESVRLRARPWTESEVEAAAALRLSLLEVVLRRLDQVARERGEAQAQHEMMLAELNHRVKNTLATIQALARSTASCAASLDSYVRSFEQRIQAMAASHNLLTESSWRKARLRALIEAQLRPYDHGGNIVLHGPELDILPKVTAPLGMVLHELVTNAVKHGALSGRGRVEVDWTIEGPARERRLVLRWREAGGPPVASPERHGFGTFALEKIIPFQLGGTSSLRYAPTGLEADITLGADCFEAVAPAAGLPASSGPDTGRPRILVVEDEAIIAIELERAVHDLGWETVGPLSRVNSAVSIARSEALDAAILDINVAGEMIWPVAEILKERGVPFLFVTGYDRNRLVRPEFAAAPVLGKPVVESELRSRLRQLVPAGDAASGSA